jgi:ankyrin repeat protein
MRFHFAIRVWLAVMLIVASSTGVRAGEVHDRIINDIIEPNGTDPAVQFLETNKTLIEERDASQCTPLHIASQYSRTNVVKWLLKHKADVNAIAYDAFTPLHLATNGGIVRLLIRGGAKCNLKDSWGRTPLQHAAELQHLEAAKAIIDSGCPLDLTSAIMLNMRDDAKKIIHRKPDQVKQPEPDSDLWGNTKPLGVAAGNGDAEMVALLLKAGAPVNATTDRPGGAPMTALCNAVWGGHYEVAELLCKAGADCNVTGGKFFPNLLDFAQKHSDPKTIQLLIQYGAKSGQ